MKSKAEIRTTLARKLAALSADEKAAASARLCEGLLDDARLQTPCRIGIFLPLPDEPDLRAAYRVLLDRGCRLAMPFPEWQFQFIQDLTPNQRGPWRLDLPAGGAEVPAAGLDLILVPGRGFTKQCQRIGRGKGIYDRLLANSNTRCIGIGFSCQMLRHLPSEPHDIVLSEVWSA